jgi:predicted small metal-binding protein
MDLSKANQIIDELIEHANTKYGLLKVGQDTLNTDILFIERYQALKEVLETTTFDHINMTQLPKMKILKNLIEKISQLENEKQKRNVRMTKAASAYKRK